MKTTIMIMALILLMAGTVQAAEIVLSWDAPTTNSDGTP